MWQGWGARIIVQEVPCRGIYGTGVVTSYGGGDLIIDVRSGAALNYNFHIDSVIGDFTANGGMRSRAVNLKVYGAHNGNSAIFLGGSSSNTYTGSTTVEGRGNYLALMKTGGAIAIQRDVIVSNEANLYLHESNQLGEGVVTVRNGGVVGHFSDDPNKEISNRVRKLVVDGSGVLRFDSEYRGIGRRLIYFDDVEIINDGKLAVSSWEYGRDFLLINKASANAGGVLGRIFFGGYNNSNIHLEDFNEDYWAVVAPEPTTYGSALGVCVLGVFLGSRRKAAH